MQGCKDEQDREGSPAIEDILAQGRKWIKEILIE